MVLEVEQLWLMYLLFEGAPQTKIALGKPCQGPSLHIKMEEVELQ
jgi:hypothetical protein